MKTLRRYVVCAVVLIASQLTFAQDAIIRVDGDNGVLNPTGDNPGEAWNNAYKYLADAINRAKFLIDLPGDQFEEIEIWIEGDTTDPYQPHLRAGPDFTQESGSFSDPIGNVSGSWDRCGSTITFTPWTGTGAGSPLTIAAEVPSGDCSTILDTTSPVTSVDDDVWLTGTLGPQDFVLDYFPVEIGITGHVLFQPDEQGDPFELNAPGTGAKGFEIWDSHLFLDDSMQAEIRDSHLLLDDSMQADMFPAPLASSFPVSRLTSFNAVVTNKTCSSTMKNVSSSSRHSANNRKSMDWKSARGV